VDRNGLVKVLDMGLARFFNDDDDILTKKYDENVLGTADYLAPEQALDSHGVDIRADIYSLGATFYFCLTGRTPFAEGTIAQKLIWHQTRQPKALRSFRPEVPEELAAVVEKMMAKAPNQRYQTPLEAADALAPWTEMPIPPPPASEMPQLSLAASGNGLTEPSSNTGMRTPTGEGSAPRKVWQVPSSSSPSPSGAVPPTARPTRENPSPPPSPSSAKKIAPPRAPAPPLLPPRPAIAGKSAAPAKAPAAPAARLEAEPAIATPAVLPAEEESPLGWEKSAADTSDSRASAKTAPQTVRKPGRPPRRSHPSRWRRWRAMLTALQPGERLWWVLIGAAVGIILIVVALCLWAFLSPRAHPFSWGKHGRTLVVNKAGGPDVFPNLRDAVASARANDVILVQNDIAEADIHIEKKKNLSIVAGQGKTVVWKCPENVPASAKMLTLTRMEGFELKDFTLDGGNRAEALIAVFDKCPGLAVQNVKLQNFAKYGVLVSDSQGTANKPIRFSRSQFVTKEGQAGVFFQSTGALGVTKNQHIVINGDCTFTGTGSRVKASKAGAVEHIELPAVVRLEVGQ
jgi:hypothetical protein